MRRYRTVFNWYAGDRSDGERAMSPVIGKALESTLIILYIALITATLYGGTVPEYRATAGSEIADRTAADVVAEIQRAVPPESVDAEARTRIDLPPTIAGETYHLEIVERTLMVSHPNPNIGAAVPIVVPDRVVTIEGAWQSGGQLTIIVRSTEDGLVVRLR